jgi:tRNA-2-methylthio-N6-dimethylallyladenosine synthase
MVKYLRSKDNFFSISTDIIVWFSWETEKMFEDTLKAFEECEFDFSYNARYSVREWTIASKTYPDDISENEKAKRWHILNDKLLETITKRNKMVLGKVEEILVYWKKGGYFYWRTRNFKEIFFKWENINVGDLVKVKIEELDKYVLKGKLV